MKRTNIIPQFLGKIGNLADHESKTNKRMDTASIRLFVDHSRSAVISLHLTHVEIVMVVRGVFLREMPKDVGHVGVDVRREAQLQVRAVFFNPKIGSDYAIG